MSSSIFSVPEPSANVIFVTTPTLAKWTPSPYITFHGPEGKKLGHIDLSGPIMKFEGDADESAKVFFNFAVGYFGLRLEQEYEKGYNEGIRISAAKTSSDQASH